MENLYPKMPSAIEGPGNIHAVRGNPADANDDKDHGDYS